MRGKFLLAVLVVASVGAFAAPAHAGLGRVVALGDSYSSGTGLGTQLDGSPPSCDRRSGGFPEIAMRATTHGAFVNQTCNGAKTQALFYGSDSDPNIPAQTAALDGSERVVILSIGGNNAQFGDVVGNCLSHWENVNADGCSNAFGSGSANTLPALVSAAITTTQGFAPSVSSTLDQIHAKSPLAKIFLIGYLRIAPADGASCNTPFNASYPRSYLNLTPNDAPVFAAWEDAMQTALQSEAAGRAFVHFVNMQPSSNAHNACNPAADRWVNSFPSITPDTVDGLNIHPSSAGAEAVSSALISAMSAAGLNLGPEISITAPANGTRTTAATATLTYTASSNLGTPNCTPASGSSVNLNTGANTLTVSCTDAAGNPSSASVSVERGSVPAVVITSPSPSTTHTTSSSMNFAYTVEGSATVPAGTTCTVNGTSSTNTQTNDVPLAGGTNQITISCTNAFGTGGATFSIEKGLLPLISITTSATGGWTAAASTNVSFTIWGSSTIAAGTNCWVNDVATLDATTNAVALTTGLNLITVKCTNAFGTTTSTVSVNKGDGPVVAITSPGNGLTTTASSVNVTFTVNGSTELPAGTTCTVAGVSSATGDPNPVDLTPGNNVISVSCTNNVGTDQATVLVFREVPAPHTLPDPDPTPDPPVRALQVSISSVSPSRFSPRNKRGARVRVTLSAASSVRLRVESLKTGGARSSWSSFELPAGSSTLRISGRTSKGPLPAGRYRVRLAVSATAASYLSKSFRIVR